MYIYIYRQLDEQFSDLTWEILQALSDWAIQEKIAAIFLSLRVSN